MISVYFMFGAMAVILTAIVGGIVGDYRRFKKRSNALKQPLQDSLSIWLDARDKIAFNELKDGN